MHKIKTLETIEHAQIDFFILIIDNHMLAQLMYKLGLFKHFERMKS